MSTKVSQIADHRRKATLPDLSDEALAVLVRDLALAEEKLLQDLCDAVLNDDHEEAKRIAREIKSCAA